MARHIEAAIPEKILKGERQIVILDVTSSGKTPALFGPYLDKYLQARGNTTPSVKLAFSWNNVKAPNLTYAAQLTDWIDTNLWADFRQYFTGKCEGSWNETNGGNGIGEHQRHSMGPNVQPPTKTNPNYKAFRDALLLRMEQDAELDGFLSTLPSKPAKRTFQRPVKPPAPWQPKLTFTLDPKHAANTEGAILSVMNKERKPKKVKVKEPRADETPEKKEKRKKAQERAQKEQERAMKRPDAFNYLSQGEYTQLRDGALAIMQQAPPKSAYYVGVGRSSGALVALLENLGTDVATYLPADGINKLVKGKGGAGANQALDKLFDAFIPEEALLGSRTIVLFQRSETGASLPYLETALKGYLQRKGSSAQVSTVSLGEARPAQGGFVNVSQSEELKSLGDRKYHQVAPYSYFRPGKQDVTTLVGPRGKPVPRSQAYGRFKTALGQRMKGDAVLDQAIRAARGH